MVDKEENRTAVIDVAILGDGTIRQKAGQLEKVWGLKTSLFPKVMDGSTGSFDLPGWMSSSDFQKRTYSTCVHILYVCVCVCIN